MWDIWGEIFPIPNTPFLFDHTKESIKEDEWEKKKNKKRCENCEKSSTEDQVWQLSWRKSLLLDKIKQEKKLLAKGTEQSPHMKATLDHINHEKTCLKTQIKRNQGPDPSIHEAAQSELGLSKCKSPIPMKLKFKKKSDIAKSKA